MHLVGLVRSTVVFRSIGFGSCAAVVGELLSIVGLRGRAVVFGSVVGRSGVVSVWLGRDPISVVSRFGSLVVRVGRNAPSQQLAIWVGGARFADVFVAT